MSKSTKIIKTINTAHKLSKIKEQIQDVKNSNLTEEEKNKALKSHNKMVKTTLLIVIILTIIMGISMGFCFSIGGEVGLIGVLISMIVMATILITYTIIIRKGKFFSDWTNAYDKVNNEFDGLEEEEITKLKPNAKEEIIIKKYKKKSLICTLIFLLVLIIEFYIIISFEIDASSSIIIISILIATVVWFIFNDRYQVEIHRLKSGYYKKSFGFLCEKCKSKVEINFEDIEKYDSLPRDESGIRVMNCPNCGNHVQFINFDIDLKDYKKYLEQVK